jgi:hypothetical protein
MNTNHKIGDLVCRAFWHKKWNKKNALIGIISNIEYDDKAKVYYYQIDWNDNFKTYKFYTDHDIKMCKEYLQTWLENQNEI